MDVARGAMSSGVTDSVGNVKKAYDALFGTFSNVISGVKTVSKAHEEGVAPLLKNADAAKEATKAAEKLAEMFNKDGETLASIQSKLNPVQKIYSEYVKGIAEANTAYQKEIELAKKAGLGDAALGQAKENLIAKNKALLDVEKAQ
jgi:ABC-type transporter Mla subunit MlaD